MQILQQRLDSANRGTFIIAADSTDDDLNSGEARSMVLLAAAGMGISRPGISGTEDRGLVTPDGRILTTEEMIKGPSPKGCRRYIEYKVQGAI